MRGRRAQAALVAASLALGLASTSGAAAQDGYVRYTLDGERGLLARVELSEISLHDRCPMRIPTPRSMTRGGMVRVTTRQGPIRTFELCVVEYGGWGRQQGYPLVRARVVLAGHDVRLALSSERIAVTRFQISGDGRIEGRIVGAVLRTPDGVRHPFDAEFSFTLGGRWW